MLSIKRVRLVILDRSKSALEKKGQDICVCVEEHQECFLKQPSLSKLKLAKSCWQTRVGVCERHKNSLQTRFYLAPTVCKRVCHLCLCRSHTTTWVCQHEFANLSLPCEGRFNIRRVWFMQKTQ